MTGPIAGASAVGTIRIRAARARSAGGYTRNSIASPTGASIPPPVPCSTRKSTSWPRLCAVPHNADATVKTISAGLLAQPLRQHAISKSLFENLRLLVAGVALMQLLAGLVPGPVRAVPGLGGG